VKVGSVDVGSVFEELGVRKFWVAGKTLLASNCVKEVETARGFERETSCCRWPARSRFWPSFGLPGGLGLA